MQLSPFRRSHLSYDIQPKSMQLLPYLKSFKGWQRIIFRFQLVKMELIKDEGEVTKVQHFELQWFIYITMCIIP